MGLNIIKAGNYTISKGDILFKEGQATNSFNILLKGKVDLYMQGDNYSQNGGKGYRIFTLDHNILIGMADFILDKNYSYNYIAVEETVIHSYPINSVNDLKELFNKQKDYCIFTIVSLSTTMDYFYNALLKAEELMKDLKGQIDYFKNTFYYLKDKYNLLYKESGSDDFHLNYKVLDDSIKDKIEYYKEILAIPMDIKRNFYSSSEFISFYHVDDISKTIRLISDKLREVININNLLLRRIYLNEGSSLFNDYISLIKESKEFDQNYSELIDALNKIVKVIKDIDYFYKEEYGYDNQIDFEYLNNISLELDKPVKKQMDSNSIPEELENSFEKIIRYSEIESDKANIIRSNIDKYIKDSDDKAAIKAIIPIFFEIYELVFKRVILEDDKSKLYDMFLKYGFMDERLLTIDQVIDLYNLEDDTGNGENCTVYNLKEWLIKIYKIEKDPSVNEFDQDYYDIFRELEKIGNVRESDKIKYEKDANGRLDFEINNMFKYNHKICCGLGDIYLPILNKDTFAGNISKSFVTKEKVRKIIDDILSIDYTAFHREILYHNPKNNIEKEIIFKAIYPDLILIPTFGCKGIMWQEITGRARNTSGRFIIPIFTNENLHDMLIKIIGDFRYELCRTMMGVSWNDITISSLTSEYTDYIQFYKKNKDLSEEAKDKVRLQVQKYNNRIKDIFTSDYKVWVKYEQKGYVRLNKVARSILFKYCPFSKPIRESLEKIPLFDEFVAHFKISRSKQINELERRYKRLFDGNLDDMELKANLEFYKEM